MSRKIPKRITKASQLRVGDHVEVTFKKDLYKPHLNKAQGAKK